MTTHTAALSCPAAIRRAGSVLMTTVDAECLNSPSDSANADPADAGNRTGQWFRRADPADPPMPAATMPG